MRGLADMYMFSDLNLPMNTLILCTLLVKKLIYLAVKVDFVYFIFLRILRTVV